MTKLLGTMLSRRVIAALAVAVCGCGTTRSSDTARTATEQLLISDAIDRAVGQVNFTPLAGQKVYLDDQFLQGIVDQKYLVSTIRQHLLASGCVLQKSMDTADFIVEARAGAVGTDRHDLLFGVPATNVPQILPFQALPAAIPEIPVAKRVDQRGIAKIAVFAYHRETGLPVWQSGLAVNTSSSNDVWLFGAGPFRNGTIHQGPVFAGRDIKRQHDDPSSAPPPQVASLDEQATFTNLLDLTRPTSPSPEVAPAAFETPADSQPVQ
jgi:hypothetical protein